MAKKITKKENHKKQPKTEKIKKRYFRTFYCSFCASFILFGLIAVLIFVYSNDKRFFGFSRRHYEKAEEYMAAEDYEKAEKEYLESLKKIQEFEPMYDTVLRQHGTCCSTKKVLEDNIENCKAILAGTDDKVLAILMGKPCRRARAVDPATGGRLDGREGNILYDPERVRR